MTDRVEPLIHGRAYFDRLAADVSAMSSGDGPVRQDASARIAPNSSVG